MGLGSLGRKIVEGVQLYDDLPLWWREQFERAFDVAEASFDMVKDLKTLSPRLPVVWLEIAMMAFTTGKIAGNWTKVHREVCGASPRLYERVGPRLPKDGDEGSLI